ncbi:hypothetical protein H0H93_004312 [Arthromyces matolae]|nr:hypothetical protein H0H93_004312 [Arthromyces matolae]
MSYANGSTSPPYPPQDLPHSLPASEPMESDIDDEVDQLISDSDSPETETDSQSVAGGHRTPGQTLLPPMRLENIMSADGNLALSKEGLFVLSIATEEFIKKMAQAGHLRANTERRTAVNYSDMCAATQQYQEFMFLNETIPPPMTLSEAVSMRAQKEKEESEEDPSAPTPSRPSTSTAASVAKKAKSRTNGTTPKTDKRPDKTPQPSTSNVVGHSQSHVASTDMESRTPRASIRSTISVSNGRLSLSARPSPLLNGHSVSAAPSPAGTNTPAPSESPQRQTPSTASPYPGSVQGQSEEGWQAQSSTFTGPASGFLQGPASGPFGNAQNPGRTIYSQQFRSE